VRNTLDSIAIGILVGMISGTHTAIWGMYKDSKHEGFFYSRFVRSMIIGGVCAVPIQLLLELDLQTAGGVLLMYGLATAAERGVTEVWKNFIRNEDQSKYFIPMQFTIYGRPVPSARMRLLLGIAYIAAVTTALLAIASLDVDAPLRVSMVALTGLATGIIVAISGGWKDAPKEGFSALKFMRSPATTLVYALVLAQLTDSYVVAAAAAIGYERATVEAYKTFCFPSRPPGKFADKPITHPVMMQFRRRFVPLYIAIWFAIIGFGYVASGQIT
jgi:hypothetical protein